MKDTKSTNENTQFPSAANQRNVRSHPTNGNANKLVNSQPNVKFLLSAEKTTHVDFSTLQTHK
jgi:hypothetical protein